MYHIDDDRTEQHDLAAEHPEQVERLAARWHAWAASTFVDRWLNRITLVVDGQRVARVESSGLLRQQPGLGLYLGYDGVHPVGEYDVPNAFQGII